MNAQKPGNRKVNWLCKRNHICPKTLPDAIFFFIRFANTRCFTSTGHSIVLSYLISRRNNMAKMLLRKVLVVFSKLSAFSPDITCKYFSHFYKVLLKIESIE